MHVAALGILVELDRRGEDELFDDGSLQRRGTTVK
jgi:hypothetical protein